MKIDQYQKQAMQFAKYTHSDYPYLALAEESGEVLGKVAKFVRKNRISSYETISALKSDPDVLTEQQSELKDDLVKELGDVLWQLSACAYELNVDLSTIAAVNLMKLTDRAKRGKIVGEGDNR